MKASFFRKPVSIRNLRSEYGTERSYKIIAEVVLPEIEFKNFSNNLLADYGFINEHTDSTGMTAQGELLCILVKNENNTCAIAVDSEGYDYARYAALVI